VARPSRVAHAARAALGKSQGLKGFKTALLALLTANTIYFAVFGTPSKAIDAGAWLALLVMFDVETAFNLKSRRTRLAVHGARMLAAVGVVAATIGYVFEDDALDAVNAVLWILVVILLEAEIRWPALVARRRIAFNSIAAALFGGLAILVVLWAAFGMWFDAYDAVLWLIAFATIEVNLIKSERLFTPVSGGVEDAGSPRT
jgi:hypothetical protein